MEDNARRGSERVVEAEKNSRGEAEASGFLKTMELALLRRSMPKYTGKREIRETDGF